jgi:hypothetical protein
MSDAGFLEANLGSSPRATIKAREPYLPTKLLPRTTWMPADKGFWAVAWRLGLRVRVQQVGFKI